MDLQTLLSRLDLSCPALAEVKVQVEAGDQQQAFLTLIEHFRSRENPRYLFDETDAARFNDTSIIEEADRVCAHDILGHRFAGPIDWGFNATDGTSRDSEWTWSLARHGSWIPLARAYMLTRDEKYAREFVDQLKSFVHACPVEPHMERLEANMGYPGDAWRSIEAGIRIYTVWLPVMVYFRQSPSWEEEGWLCFLQGLHDHAEFLCTHYSNHARCANWLTMESTALFQLGVLFPEFQRASAWKQLAYRRICHEVRYQFDHHGVHMERTPIYHLVALQAFVQAYRIAVLHDIPVPPYMLPILEKGAEFLMQLVKPDFTLPMIGDADRVSLCAGKADESPYEGMNLTTDPCDLNEMRAFFGTMAELTGRDDFLYFATGRQQGSPPKRRNYSLPDPGFHVFRTGWGETDSYFLVTGTQVERGSNSAHSHADAAHLELHIQGQDVLIDTGRYLYGNCARLDWWQYFASTRAHNTVEVDNQPMGCAPGTAPEVRGLRTFCHRYESSPELDLVEVSHNGYACLPEPVFHLRRVFFFKPCVWLIDDVLTGMGTHEFRLCFNFAPGRLEPVKTEPDAFDHCSGQARTRCLALLRRGMTTDLLEGQTEPKGGWASYAYSKKTPVPQLIYGKQGTVPVRFLTALYPVGRGAVELTDQGKTHELRLKIKSNGQRWDALLCLDRFEIEKAGDQGLTQE